MDDDLRAAMLGFLDTDEAIVIRMRHDPEAHAQRLLVALGAGWIVDPVHGERCVTHCGWSVCAMSALPAGYEQGIDGPVEMSRWCPTCHELVVAHDHKTECLWCGAQTVPAAEATTRGASMSAVATTTCKHCTNEVADSRGIYAGLCSHHKELARTARANGVTGGGNASRSGSGSDGYAGRVRALLPAAKSLDAALRKLEASGSNEKLRAEFQEASRLASAQATEGNLERLEAATKALRRGAPRRQAAQSAVETAERGFKLELGAIARDFRA